MSSPAPLRLGRLAALALLTAGAAAQNPQATPAYPQRDILSPFRDPQEIRAPADALFTQLRTMRRIAEAPGAALTFDDQGRELVDDAEWRAARDEAERIGIDAGLLATIMRFSRNADDRDVAFYGAFYCANVDYAFNLISHIPGEPVRGTREKAYPRAIAFLKAQIGRRFGDLTPEAQQTLVAGMPRVGSPEANASGITRAPRAEDTLFSINLVPFFQLLDLDDALDQAQGLWFLKEAFGKRRDLAVAWLEPALPRVRQLLGSDDSKVRAQALGVFAAIAPPELAPLAADADAAAVGRYVDAAVRAMFPPIRRVADGLMLLFPGPDREALIAAGQKALTGGAIGEPGHGRTPEGQFYRGFRVREVPEELAVLGIRAGAVVTAVNGMPVDDSKSLLAAIAAQFQVRDRSNDKAGVMRSLSRGRLVVEMYVDGVTKAVEYRVQ